VIYTANKESGIFVVELVPPIIVDPPSGEVPAGTPISAIIIPILVVLILGIGIGGFAWWKKTHGVGLEKGVPLASNDSMAWLTGKD
jgi:hypothetical protein